MSPKDLALYFHWPFCRSKCPYCDFNVHVTPDIDHAGWRDAYQKVLDYYAERLTDRRVVSVFFGGGTPSLMEPGTVRAVLDRIKTLWPCAPDMEVTLEVNPTSVETGKFQAFREAGINRVSLGVQSLSDADLKFLGRTHDAAQAAQAIRTASSIFDRMSFDLIYARPGQDLAAWEDELRRALDFGCTHMSLYQLTIERSTPFYFDHVQGKFAMPEDSLAADMYLRTQTIMDEGGLPGYEVSSHARPGEESRHNLVYWRYGDYAGIGPGAHGRVSIGGAKYAVRDHSAPDIWMARVAEQGHAHHPMQSLPPREQFVESLMMGLRLREGFVLPPEAETILDQSKIATLAEQGWLSAAPGHLRLNAEGMLRLNAIIPYILRD